MSRSPRSDSPDGRYQENGIAVTLEFAGETAENMGNYSLTVRKGESYGKD